MYAQFYGLAEQPFNLTPDSRFLFLSHRHQEALAALLFGVQERKGFICLTGEIGSGKTTLVRALLQQLDSSAVKTAIILNSYLTDLELLKTINEEFGLPAASDSKKALLDELNRFLVDQFQTGNNVLLIIDEAQNLRPETLEQIRMISNLETETQKLIQILLVGQPELRQTLALPELEQLNQRITVRYHVTPLAEGELGDYIFHRMRVARAQVNVGFTPQALRLIYHFSKGIPRRINVICDRCLLVGYVLGRYEIDGGMVQQAVDEVRGEQKYEPVPAGVASGPSWRERPAARVALAAAGLAAIAGIGIWLGMGLKTMTRHGNEGVAAPAIASMRTPTPSPSPVVTATPAPTPVVQIAAVPAAEPAAAPNAEQPAADAPAADQPEAPAAEAAATATPSPTPLPLPKAPAYAPWEFDPDKVVRVDRADHTNAAAHMTLLGAWGFEIDPSTFADAKEEEVARFDLGAMVRQLDFRSFTTASLAEAIKLDLPMLARVREDEGGPAIVAAILRMQGDLFTVANPLRGIQMLRRDELEPQVLEITLLYRDPLGITGLEHGDNGEKVAKIQELLAEQGVDIGAADGKFGPKLGTALRSFQSARGLPTTGKVDALTAAVLATLKDPGRPRLFS